MQKDELISLPLPDTKGVVSLETIMINRRSIRHFKNKPLSLKQVSQLLWSAQGITDTRGFRTAPSAGGLYPLEIYLFAGDVDGLSDGIYRYIPESHKIRIIKKGDLRDELCNAALKQSSIRQAPASIMISGVLKRTTVKYGKRGPQYVCIEVGHAGQNVLLQAVSLGLGAVPIGAFHDQEIEKLMGFDQGEVPIYIIPIGIPE